MLQPGVATPRVSQTEAHRSLPGWGLHHEPMVDFCHDFIIKKGFANKIQQTYFTWMPGSLNSLNMRDLPPLYMKHGEHDDKP